MKKILLIFILLALTFMLSTKDFWGQAFESKSETVSEQGSSKKIPAPTQVPEETLQEYGQSDKETPVNFQEQQKHYVRKCGVEHFGDFYFSALKRRNIEINDLSEQQLESLNYLTSDEFCGNWYRYVDSLAEEEKESLVNVMDEPALTTDAFDSLTNEEKKVIAEDVLKNRSNDINKRVALHYLLNEDYHFIKQIADEINTTNLSLITDSSMNLMLLFDCQENPDSCSAQSRQMLSRCIFNDNHCNLNYEAYLERTHTANEVSDYYNILAAVRRLLNI